jgi:uncharacterized phage protein gp47/JayE
MYAGVAMSYMTTSDATLSPNTPINAPVIAVVAGSAGNLDPGTTLNTSVPNVSSVTVVSLMGGTDTETDDELRARILQRIRNPPMGGDVQDYVAWALSYPGVTRAWAEQEMGIGTMTVRFLMDDLRAPSGMPLPQDVLNLQGYIDQVRPVTVKDCWVLAPLQQFVDVSIGSLEPDTDEAKAEIENSLQAMLFAKAAPGRTIFAAWKSYAVMNAPSVDSFELVNNTDDVMQAPGYMAFLRDITYQ